MEATFLVAVRCCAVLSNIVMGLLLLLNREAVSEASPLHRPYWLGMILCNIFVVKMVDSAVPLISIASLLLAVGFVLTLLSLLSLGSSFAVTPMTSKIKTRVLYAVVRHPIYLGESLMLLSCVVACRSIWAIPLYLLFMVVTALRIGEEERLLSNSAEYREYTKRTRWRLLPYIW